MLIISNDQLKELNRLFIALLPEKDRLQVVKNVIEDSSAFGIIDERDLARLCVIAFHPIEFFQDPHVLSVLIRILNKEEWPLGKRLDFIFKNVIKNNYTAST